MRKRLIVPIVVLVIIFAGWLTYLTLAPSQEVRIGYQRTLLYLPVFVADKKGFFEEEGLNVRLEKFDSANLMMQALLSRQIDATGMSALNVLATVEDEQPEEFKMFLFEVFTSTKHADHILVPLDSSVQTLADLKGKRIGVHPGTTIKMYAKIALSQFLRPDQDVKFVELSPALQVQALATRQVDALFALEPVSAIAISKGYAKDLGGFIAQYTLDPTYPGSSVFSTTFATKKPGQARRVQTAVYASLDFIREHPEESKSILAEYLNLDLDILPNLGLIGWAKVEEVDTSQVQKLLDIYAEEGVIENRVIPSAAYFRP